MAVYLSITFVFVGLVIKSVVQSVIAMTPPRRASSEAPLTLRECLSRADALFGELDNERRGLTTGTPVLHADSDWMQFRLEWLTRLRDSESRCALHSASRPNLRNAYRRLERLMELYTTHAVQFSGEVGGAVDGFHRSMDRARRDVSSGSVE